MTTKQRKVYWAGDLFDFKDLIGNRLLADAFNSKAAGRYVSVLPQDNESGAAGSDAIRDDDLEKVFSSDAMVCNFDGTDLDSGTVVEFCFAKFLDLPTVLLRTDFRNGNDTLTCCDPWNLMCSNFPRTKVLLFNAMKEYGRTPVNVMLEDLAGKIVERLDACFALPPVAGSCYDEAFNAFRHAILSAGGSMPDRFPDARIREILSARRK